jgi:hypothetical protein
MSRPRRGGAKRLRPRVASRAGKLPSPTGGPVPVWDPGAWERPVGWGGICGDCGAVVVVRHAGRPSSDYGRVNLFAGLPVVCPVCVGMNTVAEYGRGPESFGLRTLGHLGDGEWWRVPGDGGGGSSGGGGGRSGGSGGSGGAA